MSSPIVPEPIEPDAGNGEDGPDASEAPDAGEDPDPADCDLMGFAPENQSNQGQQYAELFLNPPQGGPNFFQYLQEKVWFEGGQPSDPNSIWRADALMMTYWLPGDQTLALAPGTYPIEGVDLDPNDCELCIELNTSNLDLGTNEYFRPIEATLNIAEVELGWRGAFKGTLSGRFAEVDGTRTWCLNELPFETTFDLYCASIDDCPVGATACDYVGNSSVKLCIGE
ncbi:MAG: hypothetical protein LBM75_03605 [Myxococcales bacterium]|nr:hypothetical protein [Myxococcales bacterium]